MRSSSPFRLKNEVSDQAPYCRIGKQPVSTPLVTLPQLRAHLSLLRAIQKLRSVVEEGTDERFPEYVKVLQPPQRWIWMVGLAIDRFLKWLQTIERTDLSTWVEDQLPPLDVLMVWHTYMLNPHWYAEDCDRLKVLHGLKSIDDYLIRSLMAVGDIGAYEPSDAHRQSWRDTCGTSWDPLNAAGDGTLEYRAVICPQCLTTQSVPNVDGEGHGYMQNDFAFECTDCSGSITKERLAVHKFVQDLARDYSIDGDLQKHGLGVYLPGTLRTSKRAAEVSNATSLKKRIWTLKVCSDSRAAVQSISQPGTPQNVASMWERTLMLELGYSMAEMRRHMQQTFSTKEVKIMNNILSAYTSDRPFSVELVGAVLRQGSFIEKMHELGWTTVDRFKTEDDSVVLEHAIARYHAFLDLLTTSTTTLYVPTLDIDLVWHTHQLMGRKYSDDCLRYVGRYMDHDDKVEEARLANSFDETCRAWQRQFGVPYMHCGCPVPIPESGVRRLSTVISRLRSRSTSGPTLELMPPNHADALSATHASEHNAFLFATNSRGFDSQARLARLDKLRLWQEHEERSARKDASSLHPDSHTSYKRTQVDHDPAFLAPPPFWAFAGAPLGVCTAVTAGGRGSASS